MKSPIRSHVFSFAAALLGGAAVWSPAFADSLLHGTQVAAGEDHSCAILTDTTVACWGNNSDGQLGNNSVPHTAVPVAVYLPGSSRHKLSNIIDIAASGYFTCALQNTGAVYCWGKNEYGSLGNGTTDPTPFPTMVSIIEPVFAISAGGYHACALLDNADRSARCWGDNSSGQLGDNSKTTRPLPVDVMVADRAGGTTLLTGMNQISAGGNHTCVAFEDSGAMCWGNNGYGQLGNGSLSGSPLPLSVNTPDGKTPLTAVTEIAAGGSHTCAVFGATFSADCWGENIYGQLGNPMDGGFETLPTFIPGLGVRSISGGGENTCAIGADGRVICWGYNGEGELGDGTTANSDTPVALSISNGSMVSAGHYHTCAVLQDTTVQCWGDGYSGEIGDGNFFVTNSTPETVVRGLIDDEIFASGFTSD